MKGDYDMKLQNIFIIMLFAILSIACTESEETILSTEAYNPTIKASITQGYTGKQYLKATISSLPFPLHQIDLTVYVYISKTNDKDSMTLYNTYNYNLYEPYSFSKDITICELTEDENLIGTYYYYLKCQLKDVNYEFESVVDKFTIKRELSADAEVCTDEVVDLGLSVKWRGYNLGASYPQDLGNQYGWGATATTDYYSGNNPPVEISGTEYDIARATLGGTWRLPTKEQYNELINDCLWVSTQYRAVNGYKVVGPSGKAIFLPRDVESYYWTGTLDISTNRAYYLNIYSSPYISSTYGNRGYEYNIRPVCD